MIKALSDDNFTAHLLLTGNIFFSTLKGFNVWALEKEANTGSILYLERKLNTRPIALFESVIKSLNVSFATGYGTYIFLAHNLINTAHNLVLFQRAG
jgi:hypothetical protein